MKCEGLWDAVDIAGGTEDVVDAEGSTSVWAELVVDWFRFQFWSLALAVDSPENDDDDDDDDGPGTDGVARGCVVVEVVVIIVVALLTPKTRRLCYRKGDLAMRPICVCLSRLFTESDQTQA